MFTIVQSQLEALEGAASESFCRRLARYLRDNLPDDVDEYDESELLDFVEANVDAAHANGIESEASIAQFACLSATFGLGLWGNAEMRKFLHDRDEDPEYQLERLVDALADGEADTVV